MRRAVEDSTCQVAVTALCSRGAAKGRDANGKFQSFFGFQKNPETSLAKLERLVS